MEGRVAWASAIIVGSYASHEFWPGLLGHDAGASHQPT
jgi:hypothetical protein